jgi:hypothetical protein
MDTWANYSVYIEGSGGFRFEVGFEVGGNRTRTTSPVVICLLP